MSGGVRDLVRKPVCFRLEKAHFLWFYRRINSTGPPGDVYRRNHGLDIWQICDFLLGTSARRLLDT